MEFLENSWRVEDAAARLHELLDATTKRGPQVVTRFGEEAAVVVSMEEWRRIQALLHPPPPLRPSLKDLLLSDVGRGDLNIPPRGRCISRRPVEFD
jgi:antitoxin Phd